MKSVCIFFVALVVAYLGIDSTGDKVGLVSAAVTMKQGQGK